MPDNITNIDEREWDPETKEYLNCIKYALLRAGLSDINAGKLFKPILIEGKDSICGYLTWKVNDEAIKRYFEAFIEEIEVLNCSAKRRKVVLFIIF